MTAESTRVEEGPDRLVALSDGIYAIAMTLLVLDVKVADGLDPSALRDALVRLWPQVAAYVSSFVLLAVFWRDHRRLFLRVRRVDSTLGGLVVASLCAVALLPFPTALLAEYRLQAPAVALYAGVITLIVALHLGAAGTVWRRAGLRRGHIGDAVGFRVAQDLGATVVFFGLSVPVAFLSPSAAICLWLLLIPVKVVTGRRVRTALHRERARD
ncbi:TMEM175 family protein (plasmid) [Streptomyces sp. BI20]|uniref:TMEM175 family protein n=1 Tax=Streptomyces sp. BI20 TaxID=3403460 RepID=UPI003C71C29E